MVRRNAMQDDDQQQETNITYSIAKMTQGMVNLIVGGALVSLLMFAFSLGLLWAKVNVHEEKLARWETNGTPYVTAQLSVLNEKLDAVRASQAELKAALSEHMKQPPK